MNFYIITLFPDMIEQMCSHGVLGRAIRDEIIRVVCINPRDFAEDKHRTVDDRPYGGGPGMLMKWQPLAAAITEARSLASANAKVFYMSPQGQVLTQNAVKEIAAQMLKYGSVDSSSEPVELILLAGRYEGIDERLINQLVDEEWSIGDYVLSGGEFAAMVFVDSLSRLCPGVLGDQASAEQDSFMHGLLDCPHYTRPEDINGDRVPDVLLSGNHQAISEWRLKQALGRTWLRRPDLIDAMKSETLKSGALRLDGWDKTKEKLLLEFIKEYGLSGKNR